MSRFPARICVQRDGRAEKSQPEDVWKRQKVSRVGDRCLNLPGFVTDYFLFAAVFGRKWNFCFQNVSLFWRAFAEKLACRFHLRACLSIKTAAVRPFSSLSGRLFLLVRKKRASCPDGPRFLSEGATALAGVVQTGGEVPSCPIFCFSAAGWLFGYVFAQFLALIGRIVLTSERKKAYLCLRTQKP